MTINKNIHEILMEEIYNAVKELPEFKIEGSFSDHYNDNTSKVNLDEYTIDDDIKYRVQIKNNMFVGNLNIVYIGCHMLGDFFACKVDAKFDENGKILSAKVYKKDKGSKFSGPDLTITADFKNNVFTLNDKWNEITQKQFLSSTPEVINPLRYMQSRKKKQRNYLISTLTAIGVVAAIGAYFISCENKQEQTQPAQSSEVQTSSQNAEKKKESPQTDKTKVTMIQSANKAIRNMAFSKSKQENLLVKN